MVVRVLIIAHDHVSPPGPVAERFRHHGFEVDEFLVVSQANYPEPNVIREFPHLADYDVIVIGGGARTVSEPAIGVPVDGSASACTTMDGALSGRLHCRKHNRA